MRTSRSTPTVLAIVAALALGLAACGDDTADTADLPTAEDLGEDDGAAGDAAGGTTMRVYTVTEAKEAADHGELHVSGLLIDDGSGWRLCELVLESHPPQCGGEFLQVEGLDESQYPIEEASGVRWQTDATVVGEIEGDTITVTGSPASA